MSQSNLNQNNQFQGTNLNRVLNNIPTPSDSELYNVANVDFVLHHSSADPLNIVNQKKPLTGNIDLTQNQYTISVNEPLLSSHVTSKNYVDQIAASSGAIKNRIQNNTLESQVLVDAKNVYFTTDNNQALTVTLNRDDLTTTNISTSDNVDMKLNAQNIGLFTADIQKLRIQPDLIKALEKVVYDSNVQITDNRQLVDKQYTDSGYSNLQSQVDNRYTKQEIDTTLGNYYTTTESNNKYYLKSNPSNYQTNGDLNELKIAVEGYTDLGIANLKSDSLIKTHNGLDPVYFNGEGLELKNILTPSTALSATNRGYVTDSINDLNTSVQNSLNTKVDNTTTLDQITKPVNSLDMNNKKITNLALPTINTDASSKAYVDSQIPSLSGYALTSYVDSQDNLRYLNTTTLDSITKPVNALDMNNKKITNLQAGILSSDAVRFDQIPNITGLATTSYVDTQDNLRYTKQESDTRYKQLGTFDNRIQSTDNYNAISCTTNNTGIKLKLNNVDDQLSIYNNGAATQIQSLNNKKLNLVTNNESISLSSDTNNCGVYISSNNVAPTPGNNQFNQLVIGNNNTSIQGLVCSSLTQNQGGILYPNSAICIAQTVNGALQNLIISPEIGTNLLTKNNLTMYSDSTSFLIKNLFNKNVGLNFTQTAPQSNEFITKSYADSTYTGGGSSSNSIISTDASNKIICNSGELSGISIYNTMTSGFNGTNLYLGKNSTSTLNILHGGSLNSLIQTTAANSLRIALPGTSIGAIQFQPDGTGTGSGLISIKSSGQASADNTAQFVSSGYLQCNLSQTSGSSIITIPDNILIRRDYLAAYSYQKNAVDTLLLNYYQHGVEYIDMVKRLGSNIARSGTNSLYQYVNANELQTPGSISVSAGNILSDSNLIMDSTHYIRTAAVPILDNDVVNNITLKSKTLNYFNNNKLTQDLDLRASSNNGFNVICDLPVALQQIANKQYVDSAVSGATVGTTIQTYKITLVNGNQFIPYSQVSGTHLLVTRTMGSGLNWIDSDCVMTRSAANNYAYDMTFTAPLLFQQFMVTGSFQCDGQNIPAGQQADFMQTIQQITFKQVLSTTSTNKFKLAYFAGTDNQVYNCQINLMVIKLY